MALISITINGRSYQITCDDGQESHLGELGAYIDRRVKELAQAVGQVGEPRLLVMAGLLIADELFEAKRQLAEAAERFDGGQAVAPAAAGEESMAEALEACARRIEDIAARLEGA